MGILDKIFEVRSMNSPYSDFWYNVVGPQTATGVNVTLNSSLTQSTVFACVKLYADTIASLPLILYRDTDDGKERAKNNPLYGIMHDAPNPEMTSFSFRNLMMIRLLLNGNFFAEIVRDGSNRVRELWPIAPQMVEIRRNQSGQLEYLVKLQSGKNVIVSSDSMLHISGMSLDGIRGLSVIEYHAETIGNAIALQEYSSRFFGNGARPGGVIEHPAKLSGEAVGRLRESWENAHKGLSNAHRVAILEEGMTFKPLSLTNSDSQFLESRKFQLEEICRIFRVPKHMISVDGKTSASVEQNSIDFVVYSLTPWLENIEQKLNAKLLTGPSGRTIFLEHSVSALLRGDLNSRYQSYAIGRQNGWLSVNDIRELENMNKVENGDEYIQPLNMGKLGDVSDAPVNNPAGDLKSGVKK